jgi:hypothetical protein
MTSCHLYIYIYKSSLSWVYPGQLGQLLGGFFLRPGPVPSPGRPGPGLTRRVDPDFKTMLIMTPSLIYLLILLYLPHIDPPFSQTFLLMIQSYLHIPPCTSNKTFSPNNHPTIHLLYLYLLYSQGSKLVILNSNTFQIINSHTPLIIP